MRFKTGSPDTRGSTTIARREKEGHRKGHQEEGWQEEGQEDPNANADHVSGAG